jgi:hypothetical protein
MRFPNPRRPQKNDVGRPLEKREISQFPQQPFGQIRLEGKVERFQGFDDRKMGRSHSPFRCTPITPFHFRSQRPLQKLLVGPLLLPGSLKERGQSLLSLG